MFFRRSHRLIATALLFLALFCQAALAVAGCISPRPCVEMAYAVAPCDHARQDARSDLQMNGNLCLAHATQGNQSFDAGTLPAVPPLSLIDGLVVPIARESGVCAVVFAAVDQRAASPPILILFGSFRS